MASAPVLAAALTPSSSGLPPSSPLAAIEVGSLTVTVAGLSLPFAATAGPSFPAASPSGRFSFTSPRRPHANAGFDRLASSRLAAILRPSSSALPLARPHFCPQASHNPTGRTATSISIHLVRCRLSRPHQVSCPLQPPHRSRFTHSTQAAGHRDRGDLAAASAVSGTGARFRRFYLFAGCC